MIVCPHCQHPNPEAATHCQACGQAITHPLYRLCTSCGTLNALERAHCSHCLSPLVDPSESTSLLSAVPSGGPLSDSENASAANEDPLAEIAPMLPLPEILPPPAAVPPQEHLPTEEEKAAADLLHRIATEPAPLGPAWHAPSKGKETGPSRAMRLILWLGVLLAALVPFFTNGFFTTRIDPRPQVARAAEALNNLGPGSHVLVALDYVPSYDGELTPMMELLLKELGQRAVKIVFVSTHPEGVGIARQALTHINADQPTHAYGERYLILGFLPGEERGLRLLTQDFSAILPHDDVYQQPLTSFPIMQGIQHLSQFDAVLLFTDQGNSARRWIEQVAMQTRVPTWVFTTTRVEPLLMPYFQGGQIAGLVGSAYGVLEYPASENAAPPRPYRAEGHVLLALVFVLTALLANLPRRSTTQASK